MGFLNKIQTHHSILQSVKLKENQTDISVKTQKKIDSKIAAETTRIKNGCADTRSIKEALKYLDSSHSKTGAAQRMREQIKAAVKKLDDGNAKKSPVNCKTTPHKPESNSRLVADSSNAKSNKSAVAHRNAGSNEPAVARHRNAERNKPAVAAHRNSESHNVGLARQGAAPSLVQSHEIKELKAEAAKHEKLNRERQETRTNFARVFQTSHGCKAINAAARSIFGSNDRQPALTSLSATNVIGEYKKKIGDDIFIKGNADIKFKIKYWCDDASTNIKAAADAFYTPRDLQEQKTTWRGAAMTLNGLQKLVKGETFKAGQFFSTSMKKSVAQSFCNPKASEVPVQFVVQGNSSNRVTVGSGLAFAGHGAGGEAEQLYSPRACFKVESVRKPKDASGPWVIRLTEVPEKKRAVSLPY